MKVIEEDNFDRDTVGDRLITAKRLSPIEARTIADALNDVCSGPDAPWFFKVVDDDHKLRQGDYGA